MIGLLLALLAGPASAGIAYVGGATGSGTNVGSVTVTYTTTGGNSVLVWVGMRVEGSTQSQQGQYDSGCFVYPITDTGGSTYRRITRSQTAANYVMELWATDPNAAVASTAITVKITDANNMVVVVEEYSGVSSYGPSQHGSWVNHSGTINCRTHYRTQDANNVVVTGFGADQNVTYAATTGTLRHTVVVASNCSLGAFDNTAASAGFLPIVATNNINGWCSCSLELRTSTAANPAIQLVGWGYNEFRGGDQVRDCGIQYWSQNGNTLVVGTSMVVRNDWQALNMVPQVLDVNDEAGAVFSRRVRSNSTGTGANVYELWSTEAGGARWSRYINVHFTPSPLGMKNFVQITYTELGFWVLEYSGVVALGGVGTFPRAVVGAGTPCPTGPNFIALDTGNVVVVNNAGGGQGRAQISTPVAGGAIPYMGNRGAGGDAGGYAMSSDVTGANPLVVGVMGALACEGAVALELRTGNSNSTFTVTTTGTVTNTATHTRTSTATFTRTATPTQTNTGVNSPTETNTINPSFSNTNTATHTNTQTATPCLTLTRTSTETITFSRTATDTPTATATQTPTHSATRTVSGTDTGTATSSATATNSGTATVTATVTATSINTPIEWQVCVGLTPVLIATAWPYRMTLSAGNPTDIDVFCGDFKLTADTGQLLPHRQVKFWSIERGGQLEWWAVALTPTACIRMLSIDQP